MLRFYDNLVFKMSEKFSKAQDNVFKLLFLFQPMLQNAEIFNLQSCKSGKSEESKTSTFLAFLLYN